MTRYEKILEFMQAGEKIKQFDFEDKISAKREVEGFRTALKYYGIKDIFTHREGTSVFLEDYR